MVLRFTHGGGGRGGRCANGRGLERGGRTLSSFILCEQAAGFAGLLSLRTSSVVVIVVVVVVVAAAAVVTVVVVVERGVVVHSPLNRKPKTSKFGNPHTETNTLNPKALTSTHAHNKARPPFGGAFRLHTECDLLHSQLQVLECRTQNPQHF